MEERNDRHIFTVKGFTQAPTQDLREEMQLSMKSIKQILGWIFVTFLIYLAYLALATEFPSLR